MKKTKTFNRKDYKEKLIFSLCVILLFAACIPASPPENINATPGESAVITGNSYQNDLFSLKYPEGWRVITSPAGAAPSVTFVAPGNCALIIVSSAKITESITSPSCDQPDIKTTTQDVTVGSQQIDIAGSAPSAEWDGFVRTLDSVAGSLKAAS